MQVFQREERRDRGDGRRSSSAEQKQIKHKTTTRADEKESKERDNKNENPYLRTAKGCIQGHVQGKIQ
ncbi:hypothetical protein N7448_003777 [Penicillium atrosanguineum]|uniref:Uncharacterized protein n=1 Tax=Penicillium atrosanguineum TaxID=1132637 RepID=A0A9W9L7I8_9EURO|nr:Serine/threonine-protein kinase SCH9 [Penicillium atrosanguineum]KAJ5122642.1 hypothetical protein N7526_009579 [Penicillium atrosanguineum]KAJ5140369.1 hypothetical protein N7448_003777 [Penicillium atrosanguineum]KAJ5310283.1 Serine/threonine-protein kinase SCH9 [Penicillium atrosanguineum]KAJ5315800.1 hypothetical protein N7476_006107 [Penicillium atrosanguineum]